MRIDGVIKINGASKNQSAMQNDQFITKQLCNTLRSTPCKECAMREVRKYK